MNNEKKVKREREKTRLEGKKLWNAAHTLLFNHFHISL